MNLSEKIKQLAATFADSVSEVVEAEMRDRMTNALSALGASGGSGGTEVRRGRPAKAPKEKTGKKASAKSEGRLPRRSLEEIQAVVADVVKLVSKHPDGLRSEVIRKELDLDVREVPRVLREGVASGVLKCKGQKRATTYFAAKATKKTAKSKAKAAGKKAKKAKAAPKKSKKSVKQTKASKSSNGVAGHATAAPEATA
jgi:hypothetical protein